MSQLKCAAMATCRPRAPRSRAVPPRATSLRSTRTRARRSSAARRREGCSERRARRDTERDRRPALAAVSPARGRRGAWRLVVRHRGRHRVWPARPVSAGRRGVAARPGAGSTHGTHRDRASRLGVRDPLALDGRARSGREAPRLSPDKRRALLARRSRAAHADGVSLDGRRLPRGALRATRRERVPPRGAGLMDNAPSSRARAP
jgi:hypothetical protein